MKKLITPCLWFNGEGKEAAEFYCGIFKKARITSAGPLVTEIELSGHKFILLDGGPQYKPNPSISFFYICETNTELMGIWKAFEKDGKVLMPLETYPWSQKYGWIQDRFGISWQFSVGKISDVGQKITPSLLFCGPQQGRAEEAMKFYSAIFKDFKTDGILYYGKNEGDEKEGTVKHAQFVMNGQKFMAADSALSHHFSFDEGISLTIYCENQDEIDYYWSRLTEGGAESRCGWLNDKFSVAWQVIPTVLGKIMSDPEKAQKAAKVFMEMRKLNIEQIIQASI